LVLAYIACPRYPYI